MSVQRSTTVSDTYARTQFESVGLAFDCSSRVVDATLPQGLGGSVERYAVFGSGRGARHKQ